MSAIASLLLATLFTYADGGVHATIDDRTLVLNYAGHTRTYDLAQVFPVHQHNVEFFAPPVTGCGALKPMVRQGRYVAIAYVWAEKGCRPDAAFIDLDTGRVAQVVDVDHRYDHRLDVEPDYFTVIDHVRVTHVTRIVLSLARFGTNMEIAGSMPWPFALIDGRDQNDRSSLYAFEIPSYHLDQTVDPGSGILPKAGSYVDVGSLPLHYHPEPLLLRLSEKDDAHYWALQKPDSPTQVRSVRHNEWFFKMDEDAQAGRLDDALADLSMMVENDKGSPLYDGDRSYYDSCANLLNDVRNGRISAKDAADAWPNGCRVAKLGR